MNFSELLRGDRPVVAVSFTDADTDVVPGVDVAELRIDRYSSHDARHVAAHARRFARVPTLATIRSAAEGGAWTGSEAERAELFGAVLPEVDAIDVELSADEILDGVVAAAKAAGKTVVVSFHDFDSTPPLEDLEELAKRAKYHGADYVKISTMANSPQDVRTLAEFTLRNSALGVIVIAMGALGTVSRIFFPALGSRLTYSFVEGASAPGQLPYPETRELLAKFYPPA